jgi:hypothetical protein
MHHCSHEVTDFPSPLPDNNGRLHSDNPSHELNMMRSRMVVGSCSHFPFHPSCTDASISRSLQVGQHCQHDQRTPGSGQPFLYSTPGAASKNIFTAQFLFLPIFSPMLTWSMLTWLYTKVVVGHHGGFSLLSTLYYNGMFLLPSTAPSSSMHG